MRVNFVIYARNLSRILVSPWRDAMLRLTSSINEASPVGSEFVTSLCTPAAYCWKWSVPSVAGAASILDDIFIRPVGKSHSRSHHSGRYEKAGFVTPATNPG